MHFRMRGLSCEKAVLTDVSVSSLEYSFINDSSVQDCELANIRQEFFDDVMFLKL